MNLILYKKEHYNILTEWWKDHNHAIIEESALSPYSFIVYNNDKPICASFLYVMDKCNLAQIAWTTTNPNAGIKEKYNALNLCLQSLFDLAKLLKINNIVSFSSSKGLNKLYKKNGMYLGKEHTLNMGKL